MAKFLISTLLRVSELKTDQFKLKLSDNNLCRCCQKSEENIEHLFYCETSHINEVRSLLMDIVRNKMINKYGETRVMKYIDMLQHRKIKDIFSIMLPNDSAKLSNVQKKFGKECMWFIYKLWMEFKK